MAGNIVIVDDDQSLREFLEIMLRKAGYTVETYANGNEAIGAIGHRLTEIDAVISDIIMPQIDGLALLQRLKKVDEDLPVIVITAKGTEYTVEALKQGAYDYITKPFNNDELKIILKNAIEKRDLTRENIKLKNLVKSDEPSIVFNCKSMEDLYFKAVTIAKTSMPVLLSGESGTGKELFAKLIHRESDRTNQQFFAVNCAAIPETLMESEFFGYERGAFTGATVAKPGYFELANKGTLLLDEIGDLPLALQVKLLRALEDKMILRLGGKEPVAVDVRVIAASNKNLEEEAKKGNFREDLYYRLNVITLTMPPLRDRKDDVLPLSMHFLRKSNLLTGKSIKGFTKDAIRFLEEYPWNGNVRELQNVIERACVFETGEIIGVGSLPMDIISAPGNHHAGHPGGIETDFANFDLDNHLREHEKMIIDKALEKAEGSKKAAARLLGISLWSLYHRLDRDKTGKETKGGHDERDHQ